MFQFNRNYFILTILLFLTEIAIAIYVHDDFIRPYFGDFLVVILLYCFVKSFVKVSVLVAASLVLIFSFGIEIAQHFNMVEKLGLQHLLAYALGILTVIGLETLRLNQKNKIHNQM